MRILATAVLAVMVAACTAGPDYRRPAVDVPAAWKVEAPWREATPRDAASKGEWWTAFGDRELDALERRALEQNPTLTIAVARLAQARAQLDVATAGRYPQLGLSTRAQRFRVTENRPLTNYSTP